MLTAPASLKLSFESCSVGSEGKEEVTSDEITAEEVVVLDEVPSPEETACGSAMEALGKVYDVGR